MSRTLLLASTSVTRIEMLRAAGLMIESLPPRVDEALIRDSLQAEQAKPRDIADALAEMKAAKVAERRRDALVLGCDQVLEFEGEAIGKAADLAQARAQLMRMRGKTHRLHSAAVLYDGGSPIWRHIGEARLTMRDFSDSYLDAYLQRNWPDVGSSVGCYKIEQEGIRLFRQVEGDSFTILGLPLLPLLSYLGLRGFIAT